MSALIRDAQDFFYLKLKTVNTFSDRNIPCVVKMMQNADLISSGTGWLVGVVSFNASLGASSLYFSRKDGTAIERADGSTSAEERKIKYQTKFSEIGDWLSAQTISVEERSLSRDTIFSAAPR